MRDGCLFGIYLDFQSSYHRIRFCDISLDELITNLCGKSNCKFMRIDYIPEADVSE